MGLEPLRAATESAASAMTDFFAGQHHVPSISLIDGEAFFGAILGAWLVASIQRNKRLWTRIGTLILSTGVGYLFTPMALQLAPFLTTGGAAFGCALVIIPISIKAMFWVRKADLWEILKRLKGEK